VPFQTGTHKVEGSAINQGTVFYNFWKKCRAEKMHQRTLELREKVPGVNHPSTLGSMNNLAPVLHD